MKKNVFVIGLDDLFKRGARSTRYASNTNIHKVLGMDSIRNAEGIPVERTLAEVRNIIRSAPFPVDGIIGYWDFPVSTMLPLLHKEFGTRGPSLESVLKCENKYWSRKEQKRLIPEYTPDFEVFDPSTLDPEKGIGLDFPYWVKPVRSFGSYLGFRINNKKDLEEALPKLQNGIKRIAEPYGILLKDSELPEDVKKVNGGYCLAEAIIGGHQVTLEGYVQHDRAHVYGAVDSIREPNGSSFSSYQYPSTLPASVQAKMEDAVIRFMEGIGYNDGPFNVEFFYDDVKDHIWLLEVNTRISRSHCKLFELVEGVSHQEIMMDMALGNDPVFEKREGKYRFAAKFMWRKGEDAIVNNVPDQARSDEVEKEIPGVDIHLSVKDGMRLSEMPDQDSYTFEIAVINVGADSETELRHKYEACKQRLDMNFEPIGIDTIAV